MRSSNILNSRSEGERYRVKRSVPYWLIQMVVRGFFRVYFRHRTYGLENVPDERGAVLATNHASMLDPLIAGVDLSRPFFSMAKKSLHDIPLFGSFIRTFHSFPVERGGMDRSALRTAVDLLKKDNIVLIFPEGTRTRTGELQSPRAGIGYIVLEAGCPIVPGYIDGTFEAMGPGSIFPRPCYTSIVYGEPLRFEEDPSTSGKREQYRRVANRVMNAITELKQQDPRSATAEPAGP